MGKEIKQFVTNLEDWFNSLDSQSRAYVNSAVNSVKEISQYFLVLIKLPKSPDDHILSIAQVFSRPIQELNADFRKFDPVDFTKELKQLEGLKQEDPEIVDVKELRQQEQRTTTILHTPLTNSHPSFHKFGNMHPVDRALLQELERQGYDTQDVSKEELDLIFGKALDGGLGLFTGETRAK